MSSNAATVAALWGKIVLHNKLVTAEQWDECKALFTKYGGKIAMEEILLKKKYLTPKAVEVIRKKVAEIIASHPHEKEAAVKEAAAAAAPEAPAPAAPAPAAHKSNPPAFAAPTPGSVPPPTQQEPIVQATGPKISPSVTLAKTTKDDDTEAIELADAPPEANAPHDALASKNMSDLEWVGNTDTEEKPASAKYQPPARPGDDEFAQPIELVDDDPNDPNREEKKIIVIGSAIPVSKNIRHGGLKAPSFKHIEKGGANAAAAAAAAAPPASTAPGGIPTDMEDINQNARIPCDVAPNDLDPLAVAILKQAVELHASDTHLASGSAPFFRLHGALVFIDMPKLTPDQVRRMALGFMNDEQQQHFLKHHDLDFSYEHPEIGRMRANALEQFRGPDIIFRMIPSSVPTLDELGLPASLGRFTEWAQGLVLVTGPAGSGKTTTAAALINLVNIGRKDHIITVEDPVEYLHHSKNCNVTQRQVPIHTKSFSTALKAALREDPDVIMIGEMRDLDTVSLAIRAAETGHLVIGTLQTRNAPRTIDRVIDVFPTDQQAQIRTMLSESLRGVISQTLVPRADGKGRVVAIEVLHVNNAVANLIRDAKTFQLASTMQTGRKIGQKLMDDSLVELIQAGLITREDAMKASENPKNFRTDAQVSAAAFVTPAAKK